MDLFIAGILLGSAATWTLTQLLAWHREDMARREVDALAETDADWVDDQPAEVRPDEPTPLYDRVVCERYEHEFGETA